MTFDKYNHAGAYHWRETDRRSRDYNPPLVARYEVLLGTIRPGVTLDAGAGDGYLSSELALRCSQVVAMEYEPAGAQLAAKMLAEFDNVAVLRGDARGLPFESNTLDQVVMADVIEHLEEPEVSVAEIARVMNPEGQFVLTTPMWRPDRMWDTRHVQEFRPEELTALLKSNFREVSLKFFWPLKWSNRYATRLGWRLLKIAGRLGFNPFLELSADPAGYGQMLAIAREPVT